MSGPVLITGAAGRIGTWLRGGLPERGWAVRCLDVVPVADERPGEEELLPREHLSQDVVGEPHPVAVGRDLGYAA